MGDPETVTSLPRPIPRTIQLQTQEAGLTPNEMRKLKEASGRRLDEIFGEESDLDDKTQALVWIQLRRDGYDPSWDDAGDVQPVTGEETADPTSGEPSTSSPTSATSGA